MDSSVENKREKMNSSNSKIGINNKKSTQNSNSQHSRRKTELYKTEMCRSLTELGRCKYGSKCQFGHSEEELRSVNRHPKYKTVVCRTYWLEGNCPYGKRCCFAHLEDPERKQSNLIAPLSFNIEENCDSVDKTHELVADILLGNSNSKEKGTDKDKSKELIIGSKVANYQFKKEKRSKQTHLSIQISFFKDLLPDILNKLENRKELAKRATPSPFKPFDHEEHTRETWGSVEIWGDSQLYYIL